MATELIEIRDKQIRIERFSEKLISDFIQLFKTSFGKSISREFLELKYKTEKLGGKYVGYMAFHEEKAIAYYGVLPVPFILNGNQITAVQSADTMTHPDYRRHGLFPLLAKKTYDLAKKEGASFVFGWPNQNSYPSFKKKLGWIDLGNMVRFTREVSTFPLAKLSVKLPVFRGIFLWLFRKVANVTIMDFPHGKENNIVPRNRNYLGYKESLGAFQIHTKFGTIIASLDYRLKIGDISNIETNDFPALLLELQRICRICGIGEIQIIVGPTSKIANDLTAAGLDKSEDLPLMYWPFVEEIQIDNLKLTGLDYDGF